MSLVIFATICSLAVIYFAFMPKNLNPLELTMIIIFVIFLDSNIMDILMLNFEKIKLSNRPPGIMSFYLSFLILYPLVVAWSFDRLYSIHSQVMKVLLFPFTVLLITGLEILTKKLHAVTYVNWSWHLDLVQWLTIWLISYSVHLLFRKLVLKELKQ